MTEVVAEVAQAHEGSLGLAHAYIDAAADAGANTVKFQCHIAAAECPRNEPWRIQPRWTRDESRYDYWRRMEFSVDEWVGLKNHSDSAGLQFLVSPFSVEAVNILDPLVTRWKLASGEITNAPLLNALALSQKPVIFSTGMCKGFELEDAISAIHPPAKTILQCTSMYPCSPDMTGLYHIQALKLRYGCDTGLSDHSGSIYAGLAAAALGADMIEVHLVMSKKMPGPDTASSLEPEDLRRLVEGVSFIRRALSLTDKDATAEEMDAMRVLFMERWQRKQAEDGGLSQL